MCRFSGFKSCMAFKICQNCMSGKNLVLKLNAIMLLVNQIAGFLNFNIPNTIGGIKSKLKINDVFYMNGVRHAQRGYENF